MDNEHIQWAAQMLALLEPLKSRLTPGGTVRGRRYSSVSTAPEAACLLPGLGANGIVGGLQVVEPVLHQPLGGKGLEPAADHDDILAGGGQFLLRLLDRHIQLRRIALVADLN